MNQKGLWDKEGYYMLIKDSIQQEDIKSINIYAVNDKPWKYLKQRFTELKG